MICPKCKEAEIIVVHTDVIECNDCGSTINIGYCFCPACRYSFRLNNGEFLDEMEMTTNALDEVVESLDELLAECDDPVEMAWSGPYLKSMLDFIHPCVKCGASVTVYDDKLKEYECLSCGFKWEILTND
jgi:ribosomal protein S27E